MKKITLLLVLLTTVFSFGQDLISNGSFETDGAAGINPPASWASGNSNTKTNTDSNLGSFSVNLPNNWADLYQGIAPVLNQQYKVTFYYKINNSNVDPSDGPKVRILGDDVANSLTDVILSNGGADIVLDHTAETYTMATFSFTVTDAAYSNIRLHYWKPERKAGGTLVNNSAKIDDVSIVEDNTASIEDLQKFSFAYYPNPTQDNLKLSSAKPIENIQLYNILGQQVLNKDVNESKPNINVSNLSKGVYIMKVKIEDTVGSFKFIKE